jgi:hypothetical protein
MALRRLKLSLNMYIAFSGSGYQHITNLPLASKLNHQRTQTENIFFYISNNGSFLRFYEIHTHTKNLPENDVAI